MCHFTQPPGESTVAKKTEAAIEGFSTEKRGEAWNRRPQCEGLVNGPSPRKVLPPQTHIQIAVGSAQYSDHPEEKETPG